MTANSKQIDGSHYNRGERKQHWDIIEEQGIGYIEGVGSKYIDRWRKKNGVVDLQKTIHYIEKLIELASTIVRKPRSVPDKSVILKWCEEGGMNIVEASAFINFTCWSSIQDLYTARSKIQYLIETAPPPMEFSVLNLGVNNGTYTDVPIKELNIPGTPEDGGHHAKESE